MWNRLSILILRYRLFFLFFLLFATAFLGWQAFKVEFSYELARIVPPHNEKFIEFEKFKEQFGEDGNVMVLGVKSTRIYKLDFFNDWQQLGVDIGQLEGILNVLTVSNAPVIYKNTEKRAFELRPLVETPLENQEKLDSLWMYFKNLPFYQGLLHAPETDALLMAISFDQVQMASRGRIGITGEIVELSGYLQEKYDVEVHFSGMPFIRSYNVTAISSELTRFFVLAMLIVALILLILFRNKYAVTFSLTVVVLGAIWSVGIIGLLGHKITLLNGLIPTLIVVIGIPNCIYMINKYHSEYKKHRNKSKALSRMIARVGNVTFFTNLTTAIGFGVFYFTDAEILSQFGIAAFLNILALFVISIIAIPVVFSYLPPPEKRHTGHLDSSFFSGILNTFEYWTKNHRKVIYLTALVLICGAVYGICQLESRGFMLDDVPRESKVYQDLKFFETNFKGIMPFDITINTHGKEDVTDLAFLEKLSRATDTLSRYDVFSKSLSLAEAMKFGFQAYHNNSPSAYRLPNQFEVRQDPFLRGYLRNSQLENNEGLTSGFTGNDNSIARINLQVADIGSDSMPILLASLQPKFDSIFPPDRYEVVFTGTSIISLEGFNYLIDGLVFSLLLAFLLISLIIAYLFRSVRMLFIALIPNIIPLMTIAGIMGYFSIPLKPSTVLIFSVTFGISIDYTIHFLAKYRQEFFRHDWNISKTVEVSLRETGISMIYTSLILFFGFIIFTFSQFEGTVNLGRLTSITLIVALLSNLVILPSLLISFERMVNRRAIRKEQLIDVYNEEVEIELEKLDFKHEK